MKASSRRQFFPNGLAESSNTTPGPTTNQAAPAGNYPELPPKPLLKNQQKPSAWKVEISTSRRERDTPPRRRKLIPPQWPPTQWILAHFLLVHHKRLVIRCQIPHVSQPLCEMP
jgi:hypothetical protein